MQSITIERNADNSLLSVSCGSKRSFRRCSRTTEMDGMSLSAALLDPQLQRRTSAKQKHKKAVQTIYFLYNFIKKAFFFLVLLLESHEIALYSLFINWIFCEMLLF